MRLLPCFTNPSRPRISDASIPLLPPDLFDEIRTSMDVRCDTPAAARSARLWERMLDRETMSGRYDRSLAWLLLLVADMRFVLGSKLRALLLYDKLDAILMEQHLQQWITYTRTTVLREIQDRMHIYMCVTSFTPSQRWRSCIDASLPYCRLQRSKLSAIQEEWSLVDHRAFIRLHALETNIMEGIFTIDENLLQGIVLGRQPVGYIKIIDGEVRQGGDALCIVRDTEEAIEVLEKLVAEDGFNLSVNMICLLHKVMMKTAEVVYVTKSYGSHIAYTNVGITRQHTRVNVTASSGDFKVQFCPWDRVEEELEVFCQQFNVMMSRSDIDPFAAAAWAGFVFVTIHPFEDGNGRLSRIISSIPLIKRGLPPICLLASKKTQYIQQVNFVRANRDGDYSSYMEFLCGETMRSMMYLKSLDSQVVS